MLKIDINCDLGEGFGSYSYGHDQLLLPYINSANIACGFHAGDPTVIANTIEAALSQGVAIGAHPSYPDLQGFGRRYMQLQPEEIYHLVLYQVAALQGLTTALGGKLQHVKAHGALYNAAATDKDIALAIAEAVYKVAPEAILFGLANSALIAAGEEIGLRTAQEVFVDRTYQADGRLTPRSSAQALITDETEAIQQALLMGKEGRVMTTTGQSIPVKAETICLHGDHPQAVTFAQKLREAFTAANIGMEPVGLWK